MLALRISVTVVPLLASLGFGWMVMEGHLDLGGGDKDILFVAVLLLWSSIFLLSKLTLWLQGFAFGQSVSVSAGISTGLTALAWVVLFVFSWLVSG